MKHLNFALLCLTFLPFAPSTHAQSEKPAGLSWRGRAQLKTVASHTSHAQWKARASYPAFTADKPLARFASWRERLQAQKDVADAVKEFADYAKDDGAGGYEFEATPTLNFFGPNLISLETFAYIDTRGAHPNSWRAQRNYGIANGRPQRLTLSDFFRPNSNYRAQTSAKILGKLRQNENAMWISDGTVKGLTTDQLNNFSVAPDGLTWIFNPYEMGPYAVGYVETKLNLSELGPDFRRELLKK